MLSTRMNPTNAEILAELKENRRLLEHLLRVIPGAVATKAERERRDMFNEKLMQASADVAAQAARGRGQ